MANPPPAVKRTTVVRKTTTTRRVVRVRPSSGSDATSALLVWIRIGVFEILLLATLFSVFCLLQSFLVVYESTLQPYMQRLKWTPQRAATERTYPSLNCSNATPAVTLDNTNSLFLDESQTHAEDAADFIMTHGGAVFSDLISPQDADELRTYLLQQSYLDQQLPILAHEHRRSIALHALEHSSIPKALKSIAHSTLLKDTLEGLLGPNPALLALSTIVAEEGAHDQGFHVDKPSKGSAMQFTHTFAPNYALLIPLQDTTAEMGATAIAPGTHRCNDMDRDLAAQHGFPVVQNNTNEWKTGHGLLYHGQVRHRGSAHTQGPPRVALILTFGSRPDGRRALPLLAYFALRWDMWGFTWKDLEDPDKYFAHSWRRSLGLWKHAEADWGWTAVDDFLALMCDHEYGKGGQALFQRLQKTPLLGSFSTWLMLDWNNDKEESFDTEGTLMPLEVYFVTLIGRMRWVVLAVIAVVILNHLEWTQQVSASASETKAQFTRYAIARMVVLFLVPFTLCMTMIAKLHASPEAVGGAPWSHPQVQLPVLTNKTAPFVEPQMTDVLVSAALSDAPASFAAYARLLDFHEGNRAWIQRVQAVVFQNDNDTNTDVESQLSQAWQGLLFLQHVQTAANESGWVEMTENEIREESTKLFSRLSQKKTADPLSCLHLEDGACEAQL